MKLRSVFIVCCVFTATAALAGPSGYTIKKTVKVGGEGGWDYIEVDSATRRLFISRATHVMVLDVDSEKVVGDIPDTQGVHGIALAPDLGRGFTSNGRSASVTIFDLKTLAILGHADTAQGPDAILYDPFTKRVFTMNGRGNSSTAIDGATGKVEGTIDLGSGPEFAVADGKGHVFVNMEETSELVDIDAQKLTIAHRWPLAPCESPSGLAMDREHRRLFSGCHNKLMAITDADTGKVVASVPIGQGVDANRFDPGSQLAFSSNGDGTLTVVHEDSPDKYTLVENVSTKAGARTMAIDLKTHDIFTVTADFGPRPAATADNPRPRPPMLPDSFVVLELSRP
ncbi:MAG: YncE family protein [Candidatus Acidiferrales bacterium]